MWDINQGPGEDALLYVQSVLCFIPHDRLRAVDDAGSPSSPRFTGRQCMKMASGFAFAIKRSSTR